MKRPLHFILVRATAGALVSVASCSHNPRAAFSIDTAPAVNQDVVVNVEATGVIEPVAAVQIKSKASGQIVKMPVNVGSRVSPNELLVQVDPRQMQSEYDAAVAALKSAQDNLAAQRIELSREDTMLAQRVVTPQEHEAAGVS